MICYSFLEICEIHTRIFNFSLVYFNLKKKGITICIYNIEKRVNKKKELKEIFRKIVYTRSLNKVNLFF